MSPTVVRFLFSVFILSLVFEAATANTFERRLYAGVGYGQSFIKPDPQSSGYLVTEDVSSAVELFIGWDYDPRWSVELYYSQLGAATLQQGAGLALSPSSGEVNYSAMGVSALAYFYSLHGAPGLLSRRGLSLFAGLGVGLLETGSSTLPVTQLEDWHVSLTAGLEYAMANGFAARAQLNGYDSDAFAVSLRLLYRFGDVGDDYKDETYKQKPAATAKQKPATEESVGPVVQRREETELPVPAPVADASPVTVAKLDSDGDGIADQVDACFDTPFEVPVSASGCSLFDGAIEGVGFAPGSDQLMAGGRSVLDEAAAQLRLFPDANVAVMAFTDNVGSAASNLELSKKRALSVARYLVDRGVSSDRLKPEAYGESNPVASNADAAGRELNRRVEFRTLQ